MVGDVGREGAAEGAEPADQIGAGGGLDRGLEALDVGDRRVGGRGRERPADPPLDVAEGVLGPLGDLAVFDLVQGLGEEGHGRGSVRAEGGLGG